MNSPGLGQFDTISCFQITRGVIRRHSLADGHLDGCVLDFFYRKICNRIEIRLIHVLFGRLLFHHQPFLFTSNCLLHHQA